MTSAMDEVLTAAFHDDPVVSWLFPDPVERRRLQPYYYGGLLRQPGAEVDLAGPNASDAGAGGGAAGVAVWLALPAGRRPFDEPSGTNSEPDALAVFGPSAGRLLTLGAVLAERHPRHEAHRYLACVGVLPHRRGNGVGSALLRLGLARADADRVPAYLEASSSRSRELYLRHGFEDLGEPIQLRDGPQAWPMWRAPNQ